MSQLDPGSIPPAMPVPAEALPYSVPFQHARPGIITAIGVMCIVVACLSGIGSLGSGFYGFVFWVMSRATASMSATATTASTTTTTTTGSGASYSWTTNSGTSAVVNPSPTATPALPAADASAVVIELSKTLSLDGPHLRELDNLMRSHGRQVFGVDQDASVGAATVRSDVTEHGTDADKGSIYFTTAQGRVDIYGDRATFVSADGGTTIDTSAKNHSESVNQTAQATSGATAAAQRTTLTKTQVAQVIAAVKAMPGPPLNAKQLASLRAELSKPNQQLVTPGDVTPVSFVSNPSGGNAAIHFDTGSALLLGSQGNVISSGPLIPRISISGAAAGMVIAENAASVAVAIYLLVVGIMVFRSYPRSPRLLRIYAMLKIPLALLAGVGLPWLAYQFAASISASGMGTAVPASFGFIVWGIIIALLGCAFPIAVLIALSTRTCRDYFNSASG